MSDDYQELTFDSIEERDAESTLQHAIQWMIASDYITAAKTDCAYGSEGGLGHRPGLRWRELVDAEEEQRRWDDWSKGAGQPAPRATETLDQFLTLAINGVKGSAHRGVRHPGQAAELPPMGRCASCDEQLVPVADFIALVERWVRREIIEVACPSCKVASRLEDWDWQPDWAFGLASITFWNWPPISGQAIVRMSKALGGPRIRHTRGVL